MNLLAVNGDWQTRIDGLCEQLDELNRQLREFPRADVQRHSRQEREWERFVLTDGGQASAGGALTVGGGATGLVPAPNGWEAYVTSVAVTVSGSSAAATVASYFGEVSDLNLFDYASSLFGASPSRVVGFYDQETGYCEQSDPLSLVVTGAAANATVVVRVAGKRRMT